MTGEGGPEEQEMQKHEEEEGGDEEEVHIVASERYWRNAPGSGPGHTKKNTFGVLCRYFIRFWGAE